MHELNELELAIRSERHATLACDGIPFTVRTVIDNESGTFVFPVESSALGGEEVVSMRPWSLAAKGGIDKKRRRKGRHGGRRSCAA